MERPIREVVVLGGGTAGWMSAAYLGKALQDSVRITLLEAPTIPRIGVGEATVPNLHRVLFEYLGIAEEEWMRACNASFKMAVKLINWRSPGAAEPHARELDGRPDYFYHPFGILPSEDQLPVSHHWAQRFIAKQSDTPYDYSCFVEPWLMDANLAPRFLDGTRASTYAWHFDAQLVADFLCRHATTRLGVNHVRDEMVDVVRDGRGFITALQLKSGRSLQGDLFVDCSGFRGLLINKVMGEPFVDQSDHLLCDSAVACAVPHDDERFGVEPYTSAIAMPSGWAWKIPLLGRFGSGYVYSSRFTSTDEATLDFSRVWGLDPTGSFNNIRFRVGRNRRSWVKNCVGVGLSSCFLEPLESTGLYFTYAAVYQLARHFPDRDFNQTLIDDFNEKIAVMFDDSRDFVQAHFLFSPRRDTPFWRANKDLTVADSLTRKVAQYRAGLTVNAPVVGEDSYYGNFEAEFGNFWTNGSYFCILAGLGVAPERAAPLLAYQPGARLAGDRMLASVARRQGELRSALPAHYTYLKQLHRQ